MQDNINSAGDDTVSAPKEPAVIGRVAPWARFGTGSRATIMLGLTIGAVTVATAVMPFAASRSVSGP